MVFGRISGNLPEPYYIFRENLSDRTNPVCHELDPVRLQFSRVTLVLRKLKPLELDRKAMELVKRLETFADDSSITYTHLSSDFP